jgi:signal transduction histidine kinase
MTVRTGDEYPSAYPEARGSQTIGAFVDPLGPGAGGLSPQASYRLASLGLTSAGLAHDMGNLLQVVASALSLIDRSFARAEPANVRELCENARIAVSRMVALRGQILSLARVGPTLLQRVDPAAVISSLRGLIELTLGPGICLDIECASGAPGVICDPQEFENAILNLVVNARDAMPSGGRLRLILDYHEQPWLVGEAVVTTPPRLVLRVGDTGCGMPPEILDRVFEPFFSTKPADRGTGLGLPMVAEFARRAHGSVEIESRLGKGTTVILNLPGCSF